MLKKIQFVFIVGLVFTLLLQLTELSNIKISNDAIVPQIALILSLNYVAIGLIVIFIIFATIPLMPLGKKKITDSALNEDVVAERGENLSAVSDSDHDIRLINLENILVPILARCNSAEEVCTKFLSATCSEFKLAQGILFVRKKDTDEFYIKGTFAYYNENTGYSFRMGEGICGQVAKNHKAIILTNIPENYVNIVSGLGLGSPKYLQAIPVISAGKVIGVIELASFTSELLQTNDLETGVLKQLSNSLKGFL